jgi:hypothetical protein
MSFNCPNSAHCVVGERALPAESHVSAGLDRPQTRDLEACEPPDTISNAALIEVTDRFARGSSFC